MTAIALPRPRGINGEEITPFLLYTITVLLFLLLGALNWSLSRTEAKRDCNARSGPFSNGFSREFDTGRCECSAYFHFAESCPTPATFIPQMWAPPL
jgi:hypothetical protein